MTPQDDLDQMLAPVFDARARLDTRQAHLIRLRQARAELSDRIDTILLRRDQRHGQAIQELSALIEELRAEVSKLTGAPVQEGVFIAPCTLGDGRRLARVMLHGGREMLLRPTDEALLDQLRAGDRVVLSSGENVVLEKSDPGAAGSGECAPLERWLGTCRLMVRLRDKDIVLRAGAALTPENLQPGDLVRVDLASGFAMERLPPPDRSPYGASEEATGLAPEALAGYDDVRDRTLRSVTYALAHPELAGRYGMRHQRPWILLGGPPGVGKSTLARILAGDLQRHTGRQCRIRRVNGAELLSPYVGETEQRIKALVREARQDEALTVIFIDEADALARVRGSASNVHSDRFLSSLLSELEGFDGRAPCVLIAATNRLDMLDAAFRSRFSLEIEFSRPRMEAARAIFAWHLPADLPYAPATPASRQALIECAVAKLYLPNAPGSLLATLRLRDGSTRPVHARALMSGRLIEQICADTRARAFQRHVEGGTPGICVEDMDAAVDSARERLRASLTPSNAHALLSELPHDAGVVAVDPAPRVRAGVTFLHEAAR